MVVKPLEVSVLVTKLSLVIISDPNSTFVTQCYVTCADLSRIWSLDLTNLTLPLPMLFSSECTYFISVSLQPCLEVGWVDQITNPCSAGNFQITFCLNLIYKSLKDP